MISVSYTALERCDASIGITCDAAILHVVEPNFLNERLLESIKRNKKFMRGSRLAQYSQGPINHDTAYRRFPKQRSPYDWILPFCSSSGASDPG